MSQPPDTAKDAALRAVGRTIANFQTLEHNLKQAAQSGPLQGTLPKIQKDIAMRQERAGTLTLGQAIQAWLNYCDGAQAQVVWTPDLFDVSIQMTFSLSDSESRNVHAKALRSLLDTRNDLIHTRLARFQWESPEACDALVLELNAVNASISEQSDYVTSLFKEIQGLQREALAAAIVNVSEAAAASTTGGRDA